MNPAANERCNQPITSQASPLKLANSSKQEFKSLELGRRKLVLPNRERTRSRREIRRERRGWFWDIEPLLSPILDRLRKSERWKRFFTSLTGLKETAAKKGGIFAVRKPHAKEIMEEKQRRWDSNKNFAKMCEGRKKKNPLWGKMVKLNLIRFKKF